MPAMRDAGRDEFRVSQSPPRLVCLPFVRQRVGSGAAGRIRAVAVTTRFAARLLAARPVDLTPMTAPPGNRLLERGSHAPQACDSVGVWRLPEVRDHQMTAP